MADEKRARRRKRRRWLKGDIEEKSGDGREREGDVEGEEKERRACRVKVPSRFVPAVSPSVERERKRGRGWPTKGKMVT